MQQAVDFVITQVWRGAYADVLARCATVGDAAEPVTVAPDLRRDIAGYVAALGEPGVAIGLIEELGKELGALLLPGGVEDLFRRAMEARGPGTWVRIRLLQVVPDQEDDWPRSLPWEFAVMAGADRARPILGLERVSLVRHPIANTTPRPLVPRDELHVLTVLNSRVPGYPELPGLQPAVGDAQLASGLPIDSRVLRDATLDQFGAAAVELDRVDFFEYSGHGAAGGGGLVFRDPSGRQAVMVDAHHLHVVRDVQVALLNACDTAAARGGARNLAEDLVRHRVPVVVAMQLPLTNQVAHQFGSAFASALLGGQSVDQAVATGRAAVRHHFDPRTWLTPVVFTRTDDGVLLRPRFPPEAIGKAVPTETVPAPVAVREVAPAAGDRPSATRSTWDAEREPFAFLPGARARALYEDRRRLLVASLEGSALVIQDTGGRTAARLPTLLDRPGELIAGQDRRLLMAVDGDAVSFVQLDPGPGWPAMPSRIRLPDRDLRVLAFRSEGSGLAVVVGDETTTQVLRLNAHGRALAPGSEARVRATSAALLGSGLLWISDDRRCHMESVSSPRIEALVGSLPSDGWHSVDVDSTPAGETVALLRSVDEGTELFVVDADGVRSAVFGASPGRLQVVRSFAQQSSGLVAVAAEDGVRVWPIEELPAWVPGKRVQR